MSLPGSAGGGDDDGRADPALSAALTAWAADPAPGRAAAVHAALLDARLLVPVAATLVAAATDARTGLAVDKETDLALLTLERPDGARAVVAFTSTGALRRWRLDARPVPVPGRAVCRAAVDEGADALLLDPGSASFPVRGADLRSLAAGAVPVAGDAPGTAARVVADLELAPLDDPALRDAVAQALHAVPGVREAWLLLATVPGEAPVPAVGVVGDDRRALPAAAAALRPLAGAGLDLLVLDAGQRDRLARTAAPAYRAPGGDGDRMGRRRGWLRRPGR